MTERESVTASPDWLGQPAQRREPLGDGDLWIGHHTGDDDILVFDPAQADGSAAVIELYSLSQHRPRRFPLATVRERIERVTDESAEARARKRYARRAELRAAHEESLATADAERRSRQRDGVIDAHRRFVDALGLEYQGVTESANAKARTSRAVPKCKLCGIVLDDFAGVACTICSGVLCSCGACSCGASAPRH